METRVLTAHIPLPLAEKVDQMADKLERSKGWIIKQALSAWIDQKERRHAMIWEALNDDKTVPHSEVEAWIDSLDTDNPLPPPEAR